MIRQIPRRGILAAGPLALAGCGHKSPYCGSVTPPTRQQLVYANGNEPDTFDPGTYAGGTEMRIINALFDGLTKFHPATLQPLAALATHYEVNADSTRFTFYLRGHRHPRGTRFANTDDLPVEFSRGHKAPPDEIPARWSDGALITPNDFVYSWRRVVDPKTGSGDGGYFYCIQHAEEIQRGKRPPDELGVRALDDFTFEVNLNAPTAHFLALQTQRCFFPVPRHAMEKGVECGRVVSGAFRLKQWRHNEKVVLERNPNYYEAGVVALQEIVFLPLRHSQLVSSYKTGEVDATDGGFMAPQLVRGLRGKRDFYSVPILERRDIAINVQQPPFNNVLLRYALNMATDKKSIVESLETGSSVALGCIPPMKGYAQVTSLPVIVDGISFDVLGYDPRAARAMLSKAGFPGGFDSTGKRLSVELTFEGNPIAVEIIHQKWRSDLNIEVKLVRCDFISLIRALLDLSYHGGCEDAWSGKYPDPATFLDLFQTGSVQSGTGWSDATFDSLLTAADAAPSLEARMLQLAECERLLLTAMPIIPTHFQVYSSLVKPYVRGWAFNPLNEHHFKYVWIDQKWRAS